MAVGDDAVDEGTVHVDAHPTPRGNITRMMLAVGLGILLEWYDFICFAQLSTTLTAQFFPPGNPTAEALSFWAVFAVGFVTRPTGSILFGHVGDKYGRKPCLVATVTIMGVATFLIGCLPSYKQVGLAAPILLSLLRAIQGIAMGGEFGCSLVYLHEAAPPKSKGVSGAAGFCAAIGGIAFGVVMVMIVTAACTPKQLLQWGWRVPFLLAFLTAGAALLLRLHMEEPPEFVAAAAEAEEQAKAAAAERGAVGAAPTFAERFAAFSFVALVRDSWPRVLLQFGFETSVSVCFWLSTSYLPGLFRKAFGMGTELSLGALLVNLLAMVPVMLLSGWAADRPGFPRMTAAIGVYAALAGLSLPMFLAFPRGVAACWLLQLVFMLLLAWVLGMLPISMSVLYPPLQRTTGFNFAHNCAMSLMGGLAPTVVTAIGLTTGNTLTAPGWYMFAATLFSMASGVLILLTVPEANKDTNASSHSRADMRIEL